MKLFPTSFHLRRAAAACAFAALGSVAAPSFALTVYTLNVPTGPTYGTVSLTQFDSDTVAVHAVLSTGYNFVDTGTHEAFGFNVSGAAVISGLAPSGYLATGAFTQPAFGNFLKGVACPSPSPCQGGKNTSTQNNVLDFHVDRAGITESSFVANSAGFTFTADVFGPGPTSPHSNLTFAVGAGSAPVVPEPETYALMLGGLGVIGFIVRRRRAA